MTLSLFFNHRFLRLSRIFKGKSLFSILVWGYTVTLRPEEMIIEEPSFAKGYGGQERTFARQVCYLEYAFKNSEEISMVSPDLNYSGRKMLIDEV